MSHALCDGERGEAHLDQQRHVAVAKVVYADPLHLGGIASALHLMRQIVLRDAEQPVMGPDVVAQLDILAHLLDEELRHRHGANGLLGFGIRNNVFALSTLIGFVDVEFALGQVEIRWNSSGILFA